MGLKTQRRTIAIGEARIGGEVGGKDHLCLSGRDDHLILMRTRDCKTGGCGLHETRPLARIIPMATQTPALVGFADVATQGVGHDLMAKADAKHWGAGGVGLANELAQRREPRVIFINTRGRPRQHDGLDRTRLRQRRAVRNLDDLVGKRPTGLIEHCFEHLGVGAKVRTQGGRHIAGLEQGEFHGALSARSPPWLVPMAAIFNRDRHSAALRRRAIRRR